MRETRAFGGAAVETTEQEQSLQRMQKKMHEQMIEHTRQLTSCPNVDLCRLTISDCILFIIMTIK